MILDRSRIQIPPRATIIAAADTGTFMSAVICAITEGPCCFVLEEFPNYRYVSTEIEIGDLAVPEWTRRVVDRMRHYKVRPVCWCDPNTQFRQECRRYGLSLLGNTVGPELRTEVAREYFQNDRIFLAPWLEILPYELEIAQWPAETARSGRFERLRKSDHTLVCLEHVLSRRPRAAIDKKKKKPTFLERYLAEQRSTYPKAGVRPDPHLGAG